MAIYFPFRANRKPERLDDTAYSDRLSRTIQLASNIFKEMAQLCETESMIEAASASATVGDNFKFLFGRRGKARTPEMNELRTQLRATEKVWNDFLKLGLGRIVTLEECNSQKTVDPASNVYDLRPRLQAPMPKQYIGSLCSRSPEPFVILLRLDDLSLRRHDFPPDAIVRAELVSYDNPEPKYMVLPPPYSSD